MSNIQVRNNAIYHLRLILFLSAYLPFLKEKVYLSDHGKVRVPQSHLNHVTSFSRIWGEIYVIGEQPSLVVRLLISYNS
jgi:hypothetical protein